jgi:hypothetical protein
MSFLEYYYLRHIDKVVVCASDSEIPESALLNEGRWIESGKKDWMVRVDPPDPTIPLQRHVHIARSKHTSSKNMQASWNEDKTRHDKGTFNDSVGSLRVVQDLAKDALNLPSDAILEHVENPRRMLTESRRSSDAISIVYLQLSGQHA